MGAVDDDNKKKFPGVLIFLLRLVVLVVVVVVGQYGKAWTRPPLTFATTARTTAAIRSNPWRAMTSTPPANVILRDCDADDDDGMEKKDDVGCNGCLRIRRRDRGGLMVIVRYDTGYRPIINTLSKSESENSKLSLLLPYHSTTKS